MIIDDELIFGINRILQEDFVMEEFVEGLKEARAEAAEGKLIPQEKVFKELGLI